jgi:hypothetical protein
MKTMDLLSSSGEIDREMGDGDENGSSLVFHRMNEDGDGDDENSEPRSRGGKKDG